MATCYNECFSDVNFRGSHYANPGTNISDVLVNKDKCTCN